MLVIVVQVFDYQLLGPFGQGLMVEALVRDFKSHKRLMSLNILQLRMNTGLGSSGPVLQCLEGPEPYMFHL